MSDEPEAEAAEAAEDPDGATQDAAEAAEAETDEPGEGFEDGDFVRLEYTIRTVEEGTVVDTTDGDLAEEEGLEVEDREFGPRTIVIGAGHVFAQVEEELLGAEVGDAGSVTIPAADAFGEFDPDQVRTISADRIPEDQRRPGAHVNIDNQHGHVETVIGGRARVDFNHPLAGDDIEYEYEVVDVVEDREERAAALLEMYVDVDLDMHFGTEEDEETTYDEEAEEETTETVELETLYIEATPQLAMNQQWLFSKQQIAQELTDRLGIDRVVVREVIDGGGMGGLGGMGGMGGFEEALEDADVDADEIVEELEADVPDAEGAEAPAPGDETTEE